MLVYELTQTDFRSKNPYHLIFFKKSNINITLLSKQMAQYTNNLLLEQLEQLAVTFNCYLVPAECIHWHRKKKFKANKIGNRTYYLIQRDKITKCEFQKLIDYLDKNKIDYEEK